MFGLVKPYTPDLYIRENNYYKSVYCGLCRSMGKHTTELSCAALSFDMTFFALVRILLTGERPEIKAKRCYVHPLKKRAVMCDSEALEYSAYVSAFLSYYKIEDDVNDSRGIKRFFSRVALFFAKIPLRKIPASYAPLGAKIRDSLEMLSLYEKQYCAEPSAVADCFGEIIGFSLAYGLDDEKMRIAYELGKSVGRWVYLADAAVDFGSDMKTGSYNPYVYALEKYEVKKFFSERLDGILSMELVRANAAAELLDNGSDCFGCVKNIITKGMRKSLSESLEKASGDINSVLQANDKKGENA